MQFTNVRANYDCNMRPNIFWKCKTFLLLTGCRHYLNIDPWRNLFGFFGRLQHHSCFRHALRTAAIGFRDK